MTTVGYGDVVPVTPWGQAAGGRDRRHRHRHGRPAGRPARIRLLEQLHQRRREFETAVDRILASGTIGPEEGHEIRAFRDRLGLSDHQAAEIVRLLAHQRRAAHCPHCGQALGPATFARDALPGPREARRRPAARTGPRPRARYRSRDGGGARGASAASNTLAAMPPALQSARDVARSSPHRREHFREEHS